MDEWCFYTGFQNTPFRIRKPRSGIGNLTSDLEIGHTYVDINGCRIPPVLGSVINEFE
jgi:hypothetical protein